MDKDFKNLLRQSNLNIETLFELILIFIVWRYLSAVALTDQPGSYKWNDPGDEFHFDNFYHHNNQKSTLIFYSTLKKWSEANTQLEHLFNIDERNLNFDTIADVWSIVKTLASLLPPSKWHDKTYSKTLLDTLSSLFLSDWQLAHEYFTPKDISLLMAGIIKREDEVTVYDPSCGSGDLLHAASIELPNVLSAIGITQSSFMHKLIQIRSFLTDVPFDSFYQEQEVRDLKFDIILANPPFGIKETGYKRDAKENKWSKLSFSKRSESGYLALILNHLSTKGIAVVIVPNGFLIEKASGLLRKEIVEENLLEAIIHLPKNIFYQTRVSASLLILNKQKTNTNTLFIDASALAVKNKDGIELPAPAIQSILNLYHGNQANENLPIIKTTAYIEMGSLREKEYNLQYASYAEQVKDIPGKPSAEILKECVTLEQELIDIKIRIEHIIVHPKNA
jgi:type I restriction enzyme M protein